MKCNKKARRYFAIEFVTHSDFVESTSVSNVVVHCVNLKTDVVNVRH